ncbi:MAG: hypothetical protein OHK0029_32000 [Armatimonadaceae bacterium]
MEIKGESKIRGGQTLEDPFVEKPGSAAEYEFRWDVEVPISTKRFGQHFSKQWRKVLQAQKLTPLINAGITPCRAQYQLLGSTGEESAPAELLSEREDQIVQELVRLRWNQARPEDRIQGKPAGNHPAGWQGVRIWLAFARQDVESVLEKKPRFP